MAGLSWGEPTTSKNQNCKKLKGLTHNEKYDSYTEHSLVTQTYHMSSWVSPRPAGAHVKTENSLSLLKPCNAPQRNCEASHYRMWNQGKNQMQCFDAFKAKQSCRQRVDIKSGPWCGLRALFLWKPQTLDSCGMWWSSAPCLKLGDRVGNGGCFTVSKWLRSTGKMECFIDTDIISNVSDIDDFRGTCFSEEAIVT